MIFKHTTQPLGSTTSPVEDLALEVAEAFDKIGDTYQLEPNLLVSFKDAVGNLALDAINPHKVSKSFTETHTITSRESSITLRTIPEASSLSITYMKDGALTSLNEVSTEFLQEGQFKAEGKLVKVSLKPPVTLNVAYRGETFALGGSKVLPNVFRNQDGTFKLTPVDKGNNTYTIEYDRDVATHIEEFKNAPGDPVSVFYEFDGDWFKLDNPQEAVQGKTIEFKGTLPVGAKVAVFANNTSIADMLNHLYKEFIEHSHGSQELTQNIDSYDLANRVIPTNILYKTDNLPNYQFPQYLNREGHNPALDAVYENALLGNLFVSREMSGDKYKGLDRDSYKVMFGDPTFGHYLKFSNQHKALLLSTLENANGLKIETLDPSKYGLSVNGSTFTSTPDKLQLTPEGGAVEVKGSVTADEVKAKVTINGVSLQSYADGLEIASDDPSKVFSIKTPFLVDSFSIKEGNFSVVNIGDGKLSKTDDGVEVTSNKTFTFKAKTVLEDAVVNGKFNKIQGGDVVLEKDGDNLQVYGASPSATMTVKVKADIKDLVLTKATAGGVTLETVGDNLEFKSVDDTVVFNTNVELKGQTKGNLNANEVVVGNYKLFKDGDDTRLIPTSTTGKMYIEGATLKNDTVESLKLGDSTLTVVDKNTIIEAKGDESITIHPTTRLIKGEARNLKVEETLTANNITANDTKYGKVLLDIHEENLRVTATDDKGVLVQAPMEIDKAKIKDVHILKGIIEGAKIEGVTVGAIDLTKHVDNDDMVMSATDGKSKIHIDAPTVAKDLTAEKLSSTGNTSLEHLTVSTLTMGEVKFEEVDDNVVVSRLTPEPKKVKWDLDAEFLKGYATEFSAGTYRLYNKEKIELDASNYLTNSNNAIAFHNTYPISFTGAGRNAGVSFNHDDGAASTAKQYVSNNSGLGAVDSEKNFYIETDATSGVYFLKSTSGKVMLDNTIYGFNDSTAQRNIGDLTKWFRQDIFVGNVESYSVNLKVADKDKRNGLVIGDTRLSVIGAGTNCPEGLTILESSDSIHMVQPMADGENCRNLTYQQVNTGALSAKGDSNIEGSLTISEDILTGGAVAGQSLIISGESEVGSITVAGELRVSEKASFQDEVEFKNPLNLRSDLNSSATIHAKSLVVEGNVDLGKDAEVSRDLNVVRDIAVGGTVTTKTGLITDGVTRTRGLETTYIQGDSGKVTQGFDVGNELNVTGIATFLNQVRVNGNLDALNINLKDSLTANNVYAIKDSYVRGKLDVLDGADIQGRTINIGKEGSLVTIDGKLQLNTEEVTLNSPFKVYENVKISGDIDNAGKIINKAGIEADSYLHVVGAFTAESTADFQSEVKIKTAKIEQTLEVGGAITGNSLTAESIAIDNLASISHLNITRSLTMASNTQIVAGEAKLTSMALSDPKAENTVSGRLLISGDLEVLKASRFADRVIFGTDNVIISNSGVEAPDGTITARTLKAEILEGTHKVQPTAALMSSKHNIAQQMVSSIPSREFVKVQDFVAEGLAVFNNPIVADTILFKELVFLESERSGSNSKGVDITARRALYA